MLKQLSTVVFKGLRRGPSCMLLRHTPPSVGLHTMKQHLEEVLASPEASTLLAEDRGIGVTLRAQERLRLSLIPRYQHLFTQISRLEHGVKFLVDLRADILNIVSAHSSDSDNPHLHIMNSCLRELLSLWFSVGFLDLTRITWQSPCDMVQKISEYEAVHPIRNWSDLKRRVGSYRRCFVFTHSSMPREPVVVLHTALTNEISSSIQSIVARGFGSASLNANDDLEEDSTNLITTAIFYSITSTQKGLQGIELGNHLIKLAVRELQMEFPTMSQFSSLSPIPGFKDWLVLEINKFLNQQDAGEFPDQVLLLDSEIPELSGALGCTKDFKSTLENVKLTLLRDTTWYKKEPLTSLLKAPFMRLCARYLYVEKRRRYALNPVANFHLRNGAVMWRINWLADTTPRGMTASCGMMVNYRYFLDQTVQNSKSYMETQDIPISESVQELVMELPQISSTSMDLPKSNSASPAANSQPDVNPHLTQEAGIPDSTCDNQSPSKDDDSTANR